MRGYDPEILGILHIGGLENFRSVFGEDSELFRDQAWYVDAHNGGASSAQLFEAGGYRFLHLALEMQPADDVLTWAQGVIDRHPGLPTPRALAPLNGQSARTNRHADPVHL